MWKKPYKHYRFLLLGFILVSCTNVTLQQDVEDYKTEIMELSQKIKDNPRDSQSMRELGIICVRTGIYDKAETYLKDALKLEPNDAQSKFYYGMALEFNNKTDQAFQVYRQYTGLSRLSPWRRLMEGRYTLLSQKIAEKEAQDLLQANKELTNNELSSNLIAVFPFSSRSDNPTYANLGRGLGEMMITDLSQVPEIELVERIRLNALMEEMALGQSGMISEGTEARFGKLLGAGKVVSGYYDVLDKKIRMDVELWDHQVSAKPRRANTSDNLTRLFIMEKKLVLGIVANMGIELTPEQRKKVLHIPTRNLQAFMEYCNGLEKQDTGQMQAAAQYYKKAVRLDPKFEMSQEKLDQSQAAISMIDADPQQLLTMTERIESGHEIGDFADNSFFNTQDKINQRLQNQSLNLGTTFIPGQDSRKTSEEAVGSDTEIIIDGLDILPDILPGRETTLPEPPPPPGGY